MKVAVLDYGVGNLHSLARALRAGGTDVTLESNVAAALQADAVVLPGVGAFAAAAERLAPDAPALREALEDGFPCIGICLGMQLLFERSDEGGGLGIGLFPGSVRRLNAPRVPHMGWNDVERANDADPLFTGLDEMTMYYANSFAADPQDESAVIGWTVYGAERFPAIVRRGRSWGVQFHPEKSGPGGLRIIRNFLEAVKP
jgi:glutamine amidotransferase